MDSNFISPAILSIMARLAISVVNLEVDLELDLEVDPKVDLKVEQ